MKKILIIAYHFPPVKISSAVQRTLKFCKYLQEYNWQSLVLTISPRAAISQSSEQLNEIPQNTVVKRSFALDTLKHLSFRGKYLSWMAIPDRWSIWIPFAVLSGLFLIKKHKPQCILSTYPIPSTHVIGLILNKLTDIPWLADFRDSMTDDSYPTDLRTRRIYRWIEKKTILNCTKAIFTTPGALELYAKRYPQCPSSHWELVPNGYDEDSFRQTTDIKPKSNNSKLTLLHSGVIYPSERDPTAFFKAVSLLKNKNLISGDKLSIILRATGHDRLIKSLIEKYQISDIINVVPVISYKQALSEMLASDGLIILQANSCNHQIPAKVYEYFRARKPIIALTDIKGDTAQLLLHEGFNDIIPLDKAEQIASGLLKFIRAISTDTYNLPEIANLQKYTRKEQTKKLAKILSKLT